jgi:hypothetical protein
MQILRLMLVLLLVLTMVCSISALDNRRLRHRRSPVKSINSNTNKQEVVINSEAFLLDFGPGLIPANAYVLQTMHDIFASLYDSTSMQDASIVDEFVGVGLHQFVVVCITVVGNDSLAAHLNNRLFRRRHNRDGPAKVVAQVSSGGDSKTDPMFLMNEKIFQAGYQLHLMTQVPASICEAADMIYVPSPSALSLSISPSQSSPSDVSSFPLDRSVDDTCIEWRSFELAKPCPFDCSIKISIFIFDSFAILVPDTNTDRYALTGSTRLATVRFDCHGKEQTNDMSIERRPNIGGRIP